MDFWQKLLRNKSPLSNKWSTSSKQEEVSILKYWFPRLFPAFNIGEERWPGKQQRVCSALLEQAEVQTIDSDKTFAFLISADF